jgi:hypothetical protein
MIWLLYGVGGYVAIGLLVHFILSIVRGFQGSAVLGDEKREDYIGAVLWPLLLAVVLLYLPDAGGEWVGRKLRARKDAGDPNVN